MVGLTCVTGPWLVDLVGGKAMVYLTYRWGNVRTTHWQPQPVDIALIVSAISVLEFTRMPGSSTASSPLSSAISFVWVFVIKFGVSLGRTRNTRSTGNLAGSTSNLLAVYMLVS